MQKGITAVSVLWICIKELSKSNPCGNNSYRSNFPTLYHKALCIAVYVQLCLLIKLLLLFWVWNVLLKSSDRVKVDSFFCFPCRHWNYNTYIHMRLIITMCRGPQAMHSFVWIIGVLLVACMLLVPFVAGPVFIALCVLSTFIWERASSNGQWTSSTKRFHEASVRDRKYCHDTAHPHSQCTLQARDLMRPSHHLLQPYLKIYVLDTSADTSTNSNRACLRVNR